MSKLNLGCGRSKIAGYINVDNEKSTEPDVIADFTSTLPFEDASQDEVLLFHTIEHIQKRYHGQVFAEIRRVLAEDGIFMCSFPEFKHIAKNWLDNVGGQRDFWEATIFGRQIYPSDHHVCAVDSMELAALLEQVGFRDIIVRMEPGHNYNTIVKCTKGTPFMTYEELVYKEIFA